MLASTFIFEMMKLVRYRYGYEINREMMWLRNPIKVLDLADTFIVFHMQRLNNYFQIALETVKGVGLVLIQSGYSLCHFEIYIYLPPITRRYPKCASAPSLERPHSSSTVLCQTPLGQPTHRLSWEA